MHNLTIRTRVILTVIVSLLLTSVPNVAHGFTSFSPPLTGATDFVTGASPSCFGGDGPIGLVFDPSHFFTTEICLHTTYRFPLTGGDFSSPEASADNGLTHGLAASNGEHYGLAGSNSTITQGLYSFDPVTLALGPLIAAFAAPQAVVVDPMSSDPTNPDLFVSNGSGIFRVHNPRGMSRSLLNAGERRLG